jgi:hypothetical protein
MSTHKGIFKNSDLESISSKLKFIGMLQPGQKISVTSQVIQENTYWTSLVRSITGENRSRVYNFISDVINDSLNILEGLSNSSNDYDIQICKNLISDLIFLRPGLTNLQDTYKLDRMYVSKIKTLMENLDVKTQELCSKRQIDYDQILTDVQKKMIEHNEAAKNDTSAVEDNNSNSNEIEVDVEGTNNSGSSVTEVEEASSEKKKTPLSSDIIVTSSGAVDNSVGAGSIKVIKIDKVVNDLSDLSKMTEEPTPNVVNCAATRSNPGSYRDENVDSAGLVSFLRTLPSEDLLLMSTHGQSNGTNVIENESSRAARRKRKKHAYQYDTYYMSTPDDITLCNENLEKGLIR